MAKLMLIGPMAQVELEIEPMDGYVDATCAWHSPWDGRRAPAGDCNWTERYDDLSDATEYAADHADRGTR